MQAGRQAHVARMSMHYNIAWLARHRKAWQGIANRCRGGRAVWRQQPCDTCTCMLPTPAPAIWLNLRMPTQYCFGERERGNRLPYTQHSARSKAHDMHTAQHAA